MSKPDSFDKKFEMKPQDGKDQDQCNRFNAWMAVNQTMEKLLRLMEGFTITEIVADSVIAKDVPSNMERLRQMKALWQDIFQEAKEHQERVLQLINADKAHLQYWISTFEKLKHLPSEKEVMSKLLALNAVLNELERHRASGLIEALSKL